MTIRHTIEAFTEPITALPTDPQLAPEELKRRLQAPAEELRAAHNALAKEVGGIADATYPDTVTREMLTPEVKQEIAAKAEQSALDAAEARLDELSAALPRKTECYFGTYTGDGKENRVIDLGFRPKLVLLLGSTCGTVSISSGRLFCYGGLIGDGQDLTVNYSGTTYNLAQIVDNGFCVSLIKLSDNIYNYTNATNEKFTYLVLK